MKLSPRDAAGFFRNPDRAAAGLLIFGEDAMRVALKRQEAVAAITGPGAEEEMRLTRMTGSDLRSDGAALLDAVKAQGFFPGPRVVLVEEATDGLARTFAAALEDWRDGDAMIVATAGMLAARSALRKLFEADRRCYAAGLYDDPPSRAEIEAELTRAGLKQLGREALEALQGLARDLGPGDFRQTLEKIALYKRDDATPLTEAEVALNAPATFDADVDEVLDIAAEGRTGDLAPVMRRLVGQGVQPVTMMIFAMRHFRRLYTVVSAPGGARDGIGKLRPPAFGPRRDRMIRQADRWTTAKLEQALDVLMETDLTLRSAGQRAPAHALVERAFVRLCYLARR